MKTRVHLQELLEAPAPQPWFSCPLLVRLCMTVRKRRTRASLSTLRSEGFWSLPSGLCWQS